MVEAFRKAVSYIIILLIVPFLLSLIISVESEFCLQLCWFDFYLIITLSASDYDFDPAANENQPLARFVKLKTNLRLLSGFRVI